MTADELVEKVARGIYDILEGPVANQDFGRQTRQWELSLVLADATIAVVLKEAAKVAKGYPDTYNDPVSAHAELMTCVRIGNAILSLIPQEDGK